MAEGTEPQYGVTVTLAESRGGEQRIEVAFDVDIDCAIASLSLGREAEALAEMLVNAANSIRLFNTPVLCDGVSTKEASL